MHLSRKVVRAVDKVPLRELTGGYITYFQLRSLFQDVIRQFGGEIKFKYEKKKRRKFLFTADFYDKRDVPMRVYFHVVSGKQRIFLTQQKVSDILFSFSQCIQHELIHQKQKLAGGLLYSLPLKLDVPSGLSLKRRRKISYLNDREEIEAFAHDLALEMLYFYPKINPDQVFISLPAWKYIAKKYPCLQTVSQYQKTFSGLGWDEIYCLLQKHTRRYYSSLKNLDLFGG